MNILVLYNKEVNLDDLRQLICDKFTNENILFLNSADLKLNNESENFAADLVILSSQMFKEFYIKKKNFITAKTHHGLQKIYLDKIFYFKAEDKYVVAYHDEGSLLLDLSLKELEKLYPDKFVRIHRNTLVSIGKVMKLEKNGLNDIVLHLFNREEILKVSRRCVAKIKKRLLK